MPTLKRFLNSAPGKVLLVAIIIGGGVFAYYQIRSVFGASTAAAYANDRIFVCSETGKAFHVTLTDSLQIPAHSPYSGKDTGYPAELCYWTADGQAKTEPTAVLMNAYAGIKGPTFCPECGRLVVGHNPRPQLGMKPPISKADYEARTAKK